MSIATIVLAAGLSRRMGPINKLLLPLRGRVLVEWAVAAAIGSQATPVVVVTGLDAPEVENALDGYPVLFARNPDPGRGLASSLHCGLELLPSSVEGVLICLGDMPDVRPEHIDALIAAFLPDNGSDICVPTYLGQRGNPVLWGARHLPALRALSGDVGGRELLRRMPVHEVAMPDGGILLDIDDGQALRRYVNRPD